jgi:hypothetical protein
VQRKRLDCLTHLLLDEDVEILLVYELDVYGVWRRALLEGFAIATAAQHQIRLACLLQIHVTLFVGRVSLQKNSS